MSVATLDRRRIAILGMLAGFGAISIDMYLPAMPAIGREFGASVADVQLTLSAFFIGFACGQVIYGPLSDRYGRRAVLLSGIALYIVASGIAALAGDVETLTAARFVHALGGGAGVVIARAIVRDLASDRAAARAQSLIMLVMAIGPLAAPILGGYLLVGFGWRAIFWVLALFAVTCLLAVAFMLPETLPPDRRRPFSLVGVLANYARILGDRRSLMPVLAGTLVYAGMFAYLSGTPFVYIELFGVPAEFYGYLFAINILGLMGGSCLNGRLVERHGPRPMLRAGTWLILAAALALLATSATGFAGLVGIAVPLFFYLSGVNLVGANAVVLTLDAHPEIAGTASAVFGTVQFALGALAGAAVGFFLAESALPMAAVIAVCAAGAFIFARLTVREVS